MSPTNKILLATTTLGLAIFLFHSAAAQSQTVQVTVLNGSEIRCAADSLLKIKITPNPNGKLTTIMLDWGDGSAPVTLMPGQSLELSHLYPLAKFRDKCAYSCSASSLINGFCFPLAILATYSDIPQENVSKIITIKFPPNPDFTFSTSSPCIDQSVGLSNKTCPSNDLDMKYTWDLGSQISTELSPSVRFPTSGTFPVRLTAANFCDTVTVVKNITVIDPASAQAVPDSGIANQQDGKYVVCLGGGGKIRLNGSGSLNANQYSWSITPSNGVIWQGNQRVNTARLRFSQPGEYKITLTVDNACNKPSTSELILLVIDAQALTLQQQPDQCQSFDYTPSPWIKEAEYFIDGQKVANFPIKLEPKPSPYLVMATLENACGKLERRDSFLIALPEEVKIISPAQDTTVCIGSSIVLKTNLGGGSWDNAAITQQSGVFTFKPDSPGDFSMEYSRGSGECRRSDVILIKVLESPALALAPQPDECNALSYSPDPVVPGAIYSLNDSVVSQFPLRLPVAAAPYVVEARLSNQCGQQILRDTFLLITATPAHIQSPTRDTSICSGGAPLRLLATDNAGNWRVDGRTGTGMEFIFNPDRAGKYKALLIKGSGSCEQKDSVVIEVQSFGVTVSDVTVCENDGPTRLMASETGGTWKSATCPACIVGDSFIPGELTGQDTLQVLYEKANSIGCAGGALATVRVQRPKASFPPVDKICIGESLTPDFSDARFDNLAWKVDGVDAQIPVSFTTKGTHNLQMIVAIGSCADTLSRSFQVIAPPPAVDFQVDKIQGCPPLGARFIASGQPQPGIHYFWHFGRSDTDTLPIFSPDQPILFDNTSTDIQQYKIVYSSTNACGEQLKDTIIQVLPRPYAEIGYDSVGLSCSPLRLILTNRSKGMPADCRWEFSDGFSLQSCQDTVVRTFYADDELKTYSIALKAINQCGESTFTDSITVIPPDVDAYFNVDKTEICPGDSIRFKDASTPIPSFVRWKFGDSGFSSQSVAYYAFNQPPGKIPIVLYASMGCGYDSMVHYLTILPAPEVSADLPNYACPDQPVEIQITSDPANQYEIDFGDGSAKDTTDLRPQHIFKGQDTTYSVTITGKYAFQQCSTKISRDLYVRPKTIALFDTNNTVYCNGAIVALENLSENANVFYWDLGDGNISFVQSPEHTYRVGKYDITLIASYNEVCFDTFWLERAVVVDSCNLFIPESFSPNGDGVNDVFKIFGIEGKTPKILEFKIFDRWGEIVFDSAAEILKDGWDGKLNGKFMNPQVLVFLMVYEIDGNKEQEVKHGTITLLR